MKISIHVFLICFLLLCNLKTAHCQAGSLDPTFGTGGKVSYDIDEAPGIDDSPRNMILLEDGRILLSGISINWVSDPSSFSLARLLSNGDLDTTFGTGGKVYFLINDGYNYCEGMKVLPDGKILLAGHTDNGDNFDIVLVRLLSDGMFDTTFNEDGIVTIDFEGLNDKVYDMALQPDGKIVLCGNSGLDPYIDFTVLRCNSDGSLDSTFDEDGKATTELFFTTSKATSVKIQPDGKIAVAGMNWTADVLARFNPDGSIDSTFASNGIAMFFAESDPNTPIDLTLQPDGKIIVTGGQIGTGPEVMYADYVLTRFNSNGLIDTAFGVAGQVLTNFCPDTLSDDIGFAIAIQDDGKIIAVGTSRMNCFPDGAFTLARYLQNGIVDSSFGINGLVTTDFGIGWDAAYCVALQPDGKILAAGRGSNDADYTDLFSVARYNPDCFYGIDLTVELSDDHQTLSSNAIGVTYQWINCNDYTEIPGATDQNFMPQEEGNYAVVLTIGGCIDTSDCYYAVPSSATDNSISVFISPNPFSNSIHIAGNTVIKEITISDITGKVIFKNELENNEWNIHTENYPGGIYFITISDGLNKSTYKLVKI